MRVIDHSSFDSFLAASTRAKRMESMAPLSIDHVLVQRICRLVSGLEMRVLYHGGLVLRQIHGHWLLSAEGQLGSWAPMCSLHGLV